MASTPSQAFVHNAPRRTLEPGIPRGMPPTADCFLPIGRRFWGLSLRVVLKSWVAEAKSSVDRPR